MLHIVQSPNPVLSQKAKKVGKIDDQIRQMLAEMVVTMEDAKDPEGVGLAAPQIGKSLQIFVIKQTDRSPISFFINPVIITSIDMPDQEVQKPTGKKKKDVQLEGCLSLLNIWGVVKRNESVILSYMDEKGTYHKRKFTGFMATIIQHEYDHLQGILFPKRVLEQHGKLYKSVKNEKGETVFEEIEI